MDENISREKWVEVLEVVSQRRPDEAEEEWKWLMKQLRLGANYFLAVHEAVRQGRWREASHPGAYLKAVAKRESRRLDAAGEKRQGPGLHVPGLAADEPEYVTVGGTEADREELGGEDLLDALEYQQDTEQLFKDGDGVWRTARGWGAFYGDPIRTATRHAHFRPERRGAPLPDIRRPGTQEPYIKTEPERLPNWAEWAQAAGLSDWEKKVVEYKMSGVGWVQARAEQPDEASRKALQAAWAKLARTGLVRLRAAAKESFPQDVCEEGGDDTE